ncbi:MAG: HAMP domain-containing sensor histidine kinase [Candidatus Electrothrix scaldis]|nr:MAG: HAMP domain-containing sensor histidine kinase [Candidatus Electrothrix sp. GW3-3]
MGQLINDLVELSRVGRIDLDKKQLDMNLLLKKLQEEKQRRFNSANIRLTIERNLPPIHGNESRVLQVFENLLSNALKYAVKPEGTEVTIGGTSKNKEVIFYVKDDGPGIESNFHEKIFGLFQRLDNEAEGTGIGLAVVKKVMQFHEGKIWVESSPGKGATFWLSFPIK